MILCFMFATLTTVSASAQSGPARTQNSQMVPNPDGVFTIDGSDVSESLDVSGGLVLDYSNDSLDLDPQGSQAQRNDQLTGDVLFSVGLLDTVELGVGLPVHLDNSGINAQGEAFNNDAQVGDLRLRPKVSLVDRDAFGFGVAAYTQVGVPTGEERNLTSTGDFYAEPGVIVDVEQGPFKVAANVGALLQEEQDFAGATDAVGSQLTYGVGGEVAVLPGQLALGGELFGATPINAPFDETDSTPISALGGVKYTETNTGLQFEVAGGGGIISDANTPDYRVMGGITYVLGSSDYDGDRIASRDDQCPNIAEDYDGFQDDDGCWDGDNDQDGIADAFDACPMQVEDKDGFEDLDGCADIDNDADGVADADDRCPTRYGLDGEGCPAISDGDEPVVINNFVEVPEVAQKTVYVEDREIKLMGRVYFDTDESALQARSLPLLNQVAAALKANPEIKLVQISGYADARGKDAHNAGLSLDRAKSVKNYLINQGVSASRLTAVGMGESYPALATDATLDDATLERMEANRRVQFRVLDVSASR